MMETVESDSMTALWCRSYALFQICQELEGQVAMMEMVESDIVTALWSTSYALFQMICQELGGQLAVIETAAEQNYIEGFLQRFGCESAPLTPLHDF